MIRDSKLEVRAVGKGQVKTRQKKQPLQGRQLNKQDHGKSGATNQKTDRDWSETPSVDDRTRERRARTAHRL